MKAIVYIKYGSPDVLHLEYLEKPSPRPRVSKRGSKKIGLMSTTPENQKDLRTLKELLETGKIVPVIDRCYPLSETGEAVRYLETGRARGKVVISMEQKHIK